MKRYTHILTDEKYSSTPILTDDPAREERETVAVCGNEWEGMADAFERLTIEDLPNQLPGLDIETGELAGWKIADGELYYSGPLNVVTHVDVGTDGCGYVTIYV